jgi:hypothetical protein
VHTGQLTPAHASMHTTHAHSHTAQPTHAAMPHPLCLLGEWQQRRATSKGNSSSNRWRILQQLGCIMVLGQLAATLSSMVQSCHSIAVQFEHATVKIATCILLVMFMCCPVAADHQPQLHGTQQFRLSYQCAGSKPAGWGTT